MHRDYSYCTGELKVVTATEERFFQKFPYKNYRRFSRLNLQEPQVAKGSGDCCWRVCQQRRRCRVVRPGEGAILDIPEIQIIVGYNC